MSSNVYIWVHRTSQDLKVDLQTLHPMAPWKPLTIQGTGENGPSTLIKIYPTTVSYWLATGCFFMFVELASICRLVAFFPTGFF